MRERQEEAKKADDEEYKEEVVLGIVARFVNLKIEMAVTEEEAEEGWQRHWRWR